MGRLPQDKREKSLLAFSKALGSHSTGYHNKNVSVLIYDRKDCLFSGEVRVVADIGYDCARIALYWEEVKEFHGNIHPYGLHGSYCSDYVSFQYLKGSNQLEWKDGQGAEKRTIYVEFPQ